MEKTQLSLIVSLTSFTVQVISFAHERYITLQEAVHLTDAITIGRASGIHGFNGGQLPIRTSNNFLI